MVPLFQTGWAGALELSARVTPETATIGDRLTYEITAKDAGNIELPQNLENPEPFEVLDAKTTAEGNAKKVVFTLTTFRTGKHTLPVYTVAVKENGKAVSAPSVTVEILSVLKPDDTEPPLSDIEPVADAPVEKSEYLIPLAIALALLVVGAAVYWYLKKRQAPAQATPAIPPLLPSETALKELDRLQSAYGAGREKEYFSGIADTVRNYLFAEYGLDAPEKTTREIERSWIPLLERERETAIALLGLCDAVKFAKAHPDADDAQRALESAKHFVRRSPKIKSNPLA